MTNDPQTHGCWHDEGRLYTLREVEVRVLFNGPLTLLHFCLYCDHARILCTLSCYIQVPGVWDHLARASVARFSALERSSGIKIHKTSGYLGVAGPRFVGFKEWRKASQDFEEKGQAKVIQRSEIRGSFSLQVCDPDSLPDHLDFLCLPSESVSCYEPGGGHLSPRAFVAAQLILARRQGARLVLFSELPTRQSLLPADHWSSAIIVHISVNPDNEELL